MTGHRELEPDTSDCLLPVEGQTFPVGFMTFADVQDRLVEAMITLWRLPDRERGWQRARAGDGPWHLVMAEWGDYDARGAEHSSSDVAIRPASLTRRQHAEMEEALTWVERLAPEDGRVVGAAIAELASGRREISWRRVLRRLRLTRGADGVRMRYGRALNAICVAENGGNPRAARQAL